MSGPMVVTSQAERVNVSEVDSIGGAKPEPEERPLNVVMEIQPGTGAADTQPGGMILELDRAKTVNIEMTVEERAVLLGKYCKNCKFFNHALGQMALERDAFHGDEKARAHLRSLFAELTETEPHDQVGDDIVPADEIFASTHAEREMARMGLCTAITSFVKEDSLVLPEGHCAGPSEIAIAKDLWEAKNSEVARHVAGLKDALFGVANSPVHQP